MGNTNLFPDWFTTDLTGPSHVGGYRIFQTGMGTSSSTGGTRCKNMSLGVNSPGSGPLNSANDLLNQQAIPQVSSSWEELAVGFSRAESLLQHRQSNHSRTLHQAQGKLLSKCISLQSPHCLQVLTVLSTLSQEALSSKTFRLVFTPLRSLELLLQPHKGACRLGFPMLSHQRFSPTHCSLWQEVSSIRSSSAHDGCQPLPPNLLLSQRK